MYNVYKDHFAKLGYCKKKNNLIFRLLFKKFYKHTRYVNYQISSVGGNSSCDIPGYHGGIFHNKRLRGSCISRYTLGYDFYLLHNRRQDV